MKKFLVIYRIDMETMRKMMETMNPEDQKKDMMEWDTWMKANSAMFTDPGAPVGKNTHVSASGSAEMSNDVAGYSIVQGESMESVVTLLKGAPHFKMPSSVCDVMEIMQMPAM